MVSSAGTAGYVSGVNADTLQLTDNVGDVFVKGIKDGAVELYHDNNLRFKTQSYGARLYGSLHLDDGTPSNSGITIGNNNDLQIFHDGSDSYIRDSGTGGLRVNSNAVYINNAAESENMIRAFEDGAVELFYDNSKKVETTDTGVTITGHHKKADTTTPAWSLRPNGNSNVTLGSGTHLIGWTASSASGNHGINNFLLGGCTLSGPGSGTQAFGGNSTGRLNVPVKGIYQITTTIRLENNPQANNIYLCINGSAIERQHVEMWAHRPYMHGRISGTYFLEANDYVEIKVYCIGGTISGYNDTVNWFKGHLVQAIT